MGQLSAFEIEDDKAFEQVVLEHQVNVEVTTFGADTLLAGDKGKSLAQFQQKALQLIHQCLFQVAFQHRTRVGQAEELQQDWISYEFARAVGNRLKVH